MFNAAKGTIPGVWVKLQVMENAVPKFCKSRTLPYAFRASVDKQLQLLEKQGVITPVEYSKWVVPIVYIPKTNGEVCICGNYKVMI